MDLKNYVRDIPDFPQPGILFRDITPLLKSPEAFEFAIDSLAREAKAKKIEVVVGIESRGFIFGAPLAYKLGLPFVPVRKAGKLPAARKSVEYSLEYGSSKIEIHQDSLLAGQRVLIIDDLLATGGTAAAAAKLVELLEAEVALMLFVIELQFLKGRDLLKKYPLSSLISY